LASFLTAPGFVYLTIFLLGGLVFALYPISISLVCDKIENRCIVQVTGVLLFSYGAGSVAGPLVASVFIKHNPQVLFAYLSLVTALFGLYGIYRWTNARYQQTPDVETVNCIPLPHQTNLANYLDPRVDLTEQPGDDLTSMIDETLTEPLEEVAQEKLESQSEGTPYGRS